eukprot:17807_1
MLLRTSEYLILTGKQWTNDNGNLIIEYTMRFDTLCTPGLFIHTQIHNQSQIYVGFGNEENRNEVTLKIQYRFDGTIIKQSKVSLSTRTGIDYIITIEIFYDLHTSDEIQSVKMNIWFP